MPEGQTVPVWVPIAWAIASVLLGKTESYLAQRESQNMIQQSRMRRIGSIYLLGMALPWVGESIAIAQGVWEYHWPLKLFGAPILALLLISYAHLAFSLIRSGGEYLWREDEHRL